MITEVTSHARPVTFAGTQANILVNVVNQGTLGGTIRLLINPDTNVSREISLYLPPLQGKGLSINYIVPDVARFEPV